MAAIVAGIIIIIPAACTPAMTTTTATIHLIPMTPTLMTAEDVILAGVAMEVAGEGIDSDARISVMKSMNRERYATIAFWVVSLSILAGVTLLWVFWKQPGSYRVNPRVPCLLNIRNVQQAVRSHANMNDLAIGSAVTVSDLIKADYFSEIPKCPTGGFYSSGNVVPKRGKLYLRCSDAAHMEFEHGDW